MLRVGAPCAWAQGANAALSGSVNAADGTRVDGVEISVRDEGTGYVVRVGARNGRFRVAGLDPGGRYTIEIRALGYLPQQREHLRLQVGEEVRVDVSLEAAAVRLGEVTAQVPSAAEGGSGDGAVVISDSFLRRLPAADRDLYAFVGLNPFVSVGGNGAVSGAGVHPRYNSYQIDGVTEQAVHGRNPAGITGGGKPIALEAVEAYQVAVAPYDVSQGDFAGALVNAVTRRGTNEWHGTLLAYGRNERLARDVPLLRNSPYDREQYAFSLGGPLARDRVHAFLALEVQHLAAPALGPSLGAPGAPAADPATVERFGSVLEGQYGIAAGNAGSVSNRNPTLNLFGRVDLSIPAWGSRLVLRHNLARGDEDVFERTPSLFTLTSGAYTQVGRTDVTAAQLLTVFPHGADNEVIAGYYSSPTFAEPAVRSPTIRLLVSDRGKPDTLQAGSEPTAEAFRLGQRGLELTDNVRFPVGRAHRMLVGARVERFSLDRSAVENIYGQWEFGSLDSLELRQPVRYSVQHDFGGGDVSLHGWQYSLYAGDAWRVTDRLELTPGIRADLPLVQGRAPASPGVAEAFGIRTDRPAGHPILLSPRLGVDWRLPGAQRVRGGVGVFTARAPLAWWLNAFAEYGAGVRALSCGPTPGDAGPAPTVPADPTAVPLACANGATFETGRAGAVTVLDPHLHYPQVIRASVAYDRPLWAGLLGSFEAVYTSSWRDIRFVNLALRGPVGTDEHGRVLYGTHDASGVAFPDQVSAAFPQVVRVANGPGGHAVELSASLRRTLGPVEALASYTWSSTRDRGTPDEVYGSGENWAPRPTAERLDRPALGVSDLDRPNRVALGAVWTSSSRWSTAVSVLYLGSAGAPFTFRADGDLNADGSSKDDPVYVPRDVRDDAEIRFAYSTLDTLELERSALDRTIRAVPCLARQRGTILRANSCRTPWVHTLNLAASQVLPVLGGRGVTLELQLFNALNLLNGGWGLRYRPNVRLLQHVGQAAGAGAPAVPVFGFDPSFQPFSSDDPASYYQFQFGARYSF